MLNAPTSELISTLATIAGAAHEGDAIDPFLVDPRGITPGQAATVVRPDTPEKVADIVKACAAARVGLIPYGGGTGLVGGQMAPDGPPPVILSLERMNRIRMVSADESAIVAEAGVTLAEVQDAAEGVNRLFPLSLASEGSCRIGGNLATNAGGTQVLRYGNARDLCLGIEAVLPSGEILHGLSTLRKDNTGYDLRHLLMGSEGTLGVITAAALKLFPRPAATVTAMLAVPSPEVAVSLLGHMREALGDQITGFELIQGVGVAWVCHYHPEVSDPLAEQPQWRVLMEVIGTDEDVLSEQTGTAFETAFEKGLATDGVIASSEAQRQQLWWIRETIPECNRRVGAIVSNDVSVPITRIATFVSEASEAIRALDTDLVINCFGHLGDGNLHYNIFPPMGVDKERFANRRKDIKHVIHDLIAAHQGSISAEHGIGRHKRDDLVAYGDPAKLAAMRAIKAALDPAGIMNPGAVIA